jgi:D-glycero-D-manno-heptose 1,7-bisphosphate phosphatase
MATLRPAVFLDRDGTLNEERSFITRPEALRLLPGVGAALQLLRAAGFACVVVTNQSAIARGLMTEADLARVHDELHRQLAAAGAVLDGIYHCPALGEHPERKPAPGLLLRAAVELHLDLAQSWMIGDSPRDVRAGQRAGCRGCILVRTGKPLEEEVPTCHVAEDLLAAARHILARHQDSVRRTA